MGDIQYTDEIDLHPLPSGFREMFLRIEMSPANAKCIIHGALTSGEMGYVEITQSGDYWLPFCNPKVYLNRLPGLGKIEVSVLGWKNIDGRIRDDLDSLN